MKKTYTYILWLCFLGIIIAITYQRSDEPISNIETKNINTSQPKVQLITNSLLNKQEEVIEEFITPVDQTSEVLSIKNQYEIISSQITGVIAFDRLSFIESADDDVISYQFNPDNPQQNPARFIRVNLRDGDDNIVSSTYTNKFGEYDLNIHVYANRHDYYIEVVAQMSIVDHEQTQLYVDVMNQGDLYQDLTNSANLYHINSSTFQLFEGLNQHDLRLRTGWNFSLGEFEPHMSQAQPFAILDTLAKGFIYLNDHAIALPEDAQNLMVHWSQDPDIIEQSTGYYNPSKNLIYISGNNAQDTELKPISTISEWNEHTILHEFGHYYLGKVIGRDDTQAGLHTAFGFGSLTLSMSEGIANALAKTILKDWQDKRVSFDIEKKRFVINPDEIVNNTNTAKRNLINQYGENYQRPYFDFSPFIEQTTEYFILSIIDPRSEYSARTTKLSDEIGMTGLHNALLKSSQHPALLTIYSLADELKTQYQFQQPDIDALGEQLELNFIDAWGNEQQPLTAHIIGRNDELLPEKVQYPLYQTVNLGQPNNISFNGGLQSLSSKRPGTLRYLKFVAPSNNKIQIFIPHITDDNGNTHSFSFNVVKQGNQISSSYLNDDETLYFSVFEIEKDEIYIIRVFDEFFSDKAVISNETVTTKVDIRYR